MNKLDQFPDSVLALIIYHVNDKKDRCEFAFINKSYYRKLMPYLWNAIDLQDSDATLKTLIRVLEQSPFSPGRHIRSVSFGDFPVSVGQLLDLVAHIPGLQHLFLLNGKLITDTGSPALDDSSSDDNASSFDRVLSNMHQLQSLILQNAQITRDAISSLPTNCPQLNRLALYSCSLLGTALFTTIVKCPLNHIVYCQPFLSDITKPPLLSSTVANALCGFHQLTSLTLDDSKTDFSPLISTAVSRRGGAIWPHLTRLEIHPCQSLNDATVIRFFERHPLLHHFNMCYTNKLTDKTLDAILPNLPRLKYLRMDHARGFTNDGIERFRKAMPPTLTLGGYFHGYGLTVNIIKDNNKQKTGPGRRAGTGSVLTNACRDPKQKLLVYTSLKYRHRDLVVQLPPLLSYGVISTICDRPLLTSIQICDVALDYSPLITTAVTYKVHVWPSLTTLELSSCQRLDDATAIRFIQTHPHLQHLAWMHNNSSSKMTDKTLDAMAVWLPQLTSLKLDYSLGFTGMGVQRLLKNVPSLTSGVSLRGCGITVENLMCPLDGHGLNYDSKGVLIWMSAKAFIDVEEYDLDL